MRLSGFLSEALGRNSGGNAVIKSARERNLLLGVDMSYRFMEPVRIAKLLENVLGRCMRWILFSITLTVLTRSGFTILSSPVGGV